MRLSVLYRAPLQAVLDWPAAHIRLLAAFLKREPPIEERIERLLARLTWITESAAVPKEQRKPLSEYLLPADTWPAVESPTTRYSSAEQQTIRTLQKLRKTK